MTVTGATTVSLRRREAIVPAGLAAATAVLTWAAAALVTFPLTEGSAYYVTVARNLAEGRGLVIDALWSYATPPLVLPRPAFELWQPLASLVMAVPMTVLGSSFAAAQLAYVALGAALAPLVWLLARQAAAHLALPSSRANWVAVGAALLAVLGGPVLLAVAAPDSTLPFAVLGVAACLAMPAAARGRRGALVALGILLGFAYLTRMEAIYLGLTFALFVALAGADLRTWLTRVAAVAATGALVVLPWWIRDLSVFGTPFPTQIGDNLWLTSNEQIFGYAVHPSLAGFTAQGIGGIVGNIVNALGYQLVDTLLVPGGVAIAGGLLTVLIGAPLARHPSGPRRLAGSSLGALLVSGTITFVVTAVLFPIATLWGTFSHGAGPLLVGLSVAAVLGLDEVVERIGRRRGWRRNNAWLAPCALVALTLPIALLQVTGAARQSRDQSQVISQTATDLQAAFVTAQVPADSPVMTNRPIWLSEALGGSTLALPPEPLSDVLRLARDFGARSVVVFDSYPTPLLDTGTIPCFTSLPVGADDQARVFAIDTGCQP
jgi:hypothetical protein